MSPEGYRPPEWYRLIRAADRLRVPVGPWKDITVTPVVWIERALLANRAEEDAATFKQTEQMRGMFGG